MPWLNKEWPIYLYGYSEWDFTIQKKMLLEKAGFVVLGYLDRNAAEIRKKKKLYVTSFLKYQREWRSVGTYR